MPMRGSGSGAHDRSMFTVECPTHGATVLLGPRRIVSLHHDHTGTTIGWRCTCGTTGTTHLGGATLGAEAQDVPAAA